MMDKNGEKAVFDTRNKRATGLRYAPTEMMIMPIGCKNASEKFERKPPVYGSWITR